MADEQHNPVAEFSISEAFVEQSSCGFSAGEVRCPVCGFENTHFLRMVDGVGYDSRDPKHAMEALHTLPRTRNDMHAAIFSCEDGHVFAIVFAQHKGKTFLFTEILTPQPYWTREDLPE